MKLWSTKKELKDPWRSEYKQDSKDSGIINKIVKKIREANDKVREMFDNVNDDEF